MSTAVRPGDDPPATRSVPPGARGASGAASWLTALAWIVTTGLVGAVALRQVPVALPVPLLWLPTFLPVLLPLAVPVLILGLAWRRRALAATAAALVVVAGALVVGAWGGGPQAVPAGAPILRVVSANLLFLTDDVDGLRQAVERYDPDVLVTLETTEVHRQAMVEAGLVDRYPHQVAEDAAFGTVLWSRLPLTEVQVVPLGGRSVPTARVETRSGPVDLVAVHLHPPTFGSGPWARQLAALGPFVEGLERPLLAGDFNATTDHWPFRALLDHGLTDAHRAAGTGLGATWPVGHRLPPLPVLRIDHVLVGDGLRVTRLRTEDDGGSDHRLLVADVAVVR